MPARDVWPEVAAKLRPDERFDDDALGRVLQKLGRHLVIDSEYGQAVFRMAKPHARRSLLDEETRNSIDHAVIQVLRDQARLSRGALNPYLREHVRAHARRAGRLDRGTPWQSGIETHGRLGPLLADARGGLDSAAELLSTASDGADRAGLAATLASLAARAGDLSDEVGHLDTGLRTVPSVGEPAANVPLRAIEA